VNTSTTTIRPAQIEPRHAIAAVIAGDETGLRHLAELLAPYLPAPEPPPEPDRWLSTKEAAEYAGTSPNVLHKAMAAREIHFEQDAPRSPAWFRREDIDAWRRSEKTDRRRKRAA